MKIRPTQTTQKVAAPERDGSRRPAEATAAPVGQPAAQVSRSSFARSLDDVTPGAIRHDLVSEVRAQLAAGTFEDSVDIDTVIDSLLADL